jgi:hypothetical protein
MEWERRQEQASSSLSAGHMVYASKQKGMWEDYVKREFAEI